MSADDNSPPTATTGADSKLEEILADYIRACESGAPPDREATIQRHPELAVELRQFFAQRDRINRIAQPIRNLEPAVLEVAVGPGQKVSYVGNYELIEEIARGGMGIVFKARQQHLGRVVALKMILAGHLAHEQDVQRFHFEAQAAANLQHPNIVAIHEIGQHDGWHYFSMDYVDGRNLSQILHETLPPARQAALYIQQIAEAIHYAHQQGTLHRDLKPSNILIDHHDQVHITDFGLAMRVEGGQEVTRTGEILGTPCYMPPEQAQGERSRLGPASDVYALGAVLYECLTGRPPFRAESVVKTIEQLIHKEPAPPRLLNSVVPRDLETICLKCLQKEPARRYASARDLAQDLERYLHGQPIVARPVSRGERTWRWCRRNPVVAGLSSVMILLLFGVATISVLKARNEARLHAQAARSYRDYQEEQRRSSQLQLDVRELEQRRQELDQSLNEGADRLRAGEEKLFDTYLQLAQAAWKAENIELADYYLNQCPAHLHTTAWRNLKQLCHPREVKFDGQRCVSISRDGRLLAGIGDGSIKIWQVSDQQLVQSLSGPTGRINAIEFSPDGQRLAAATDQLVVVWDVVTGERLQSLAGHSETVTDVAFSPDGTRLASASRFGVQPSGEKGEVILWDARQLVEQWRLPATRYAVFSHDGRFLATQQVSYLAGRARNRAARIAVWDLARVPVATPSPAIVVGDGWQTTCVAFHPTQNELAVAAGSKVEFWDIETEQVVTKFTGEVTINCLAYSADGKRLAFAGSNQDFSLRPSAFRAIIWNLITREKERILPWFTGAVEQVEFSPNGQQLASAGPDGIQLWDVTPPPDPTAAILNDIVELQVGRYDWPQWGGSRARVNTPAGNDIPISWDIGQGAQPYNGPGARRDRKTEPPSPEAMSWEQGRAPLPWRKGQKPVDSKNIKWAVPLGSQTYGNPVVANGRVFVGTNNSAGYLARYPRDFDLGVLLCFDEKSGDFLWQDSNEKLPTGRVHDWPLQGVCSTPVVDGDRLWYVTNRGEVVCLDVSGFHDGEDDGAQEWGAVFRAPLTLHADLARLRAAFQAAGIHLESNVTVTKRSDQPVWHLNVYRITGSRSLSVPVYELSLADGVLRAYSVDDAGQRTGTTEIFALRDDLFPGLAQHEIDADLRARLADVNVILDEAARLEVIEPGRSWSVSGNISGKPRQLRLTIKDELLVCSQLFSADDLDEADVVWRFDMMKELGVFQHNMANCSLITAQGMLFVCTSNGVDESHVRIPAPQAPSFIALERNSGKLVWQDNSPGENIMHAQWASPSYGVFDGQPQVIFPGGDGWVYSFDPPGNGRGGSKLLWKFDGNPKTTRYGISGRSTRNQIISFPAIYDGLVYVAMGEDPEHGEGNGHLWCINPLKRLDGGDVSAELAVDASGSLIPPRRIQAVDTTKGEQAIPNPHSAVVWHYSHQDRDGNDRIDFEETFHRSLSTPVIKDDILYVADFSGLLHCLNAKTGKAYWSYDLLSACWGSALLVDGKVYICDEDGDVSVFRHSADPKIAMQPVTVKDGQAQFLPINGRWESEVVSECNMGDSVYMTPIVANNVLYIATRNTLYAIEQYSPKAP